MGPGAGGGARMPLGLAVGAVVQQPVRQGQPIRYADVAVDEAQLIVQLRREQDQLVAKG